MELSDKLCTTRVVILTYQPSWLLRRKEYAHEKTIECSEKLAREGGMGIFSDLS